MKVYFALVFYLISIFSTALAEDSKCIRVDPVENTITGEFALTWDVPSENSLKSWRVDFTLDGSYITSGEVFWTYHHPRPLLLKEGITVVVTDTLHIQLKHYGNIVAHTEEPWLVSEQPYTMSFQFILFENEEKVVQKGEFSVISDDRILTYVIDDDKLLSSPVFAFHKADANSMLSRFQTYNDAYVYSEMTLYHLTNRIIPEPSTAALLAGSFVLLCLRRRRR